MTSRLSQSGARVMEKQLSSYEYQEHKSNDNSYIPSETAFRLSHIVEKPSVGPGSYAPKDTFTTTASPRMKFSQAHRFLPSKVGYISPRHNSDLLCTASPGPKYHVVPTAATYPRPPALSWGEKLSLEQREKKSQLINNDATDVGPAGYDPKFANILPAAPRCAFSRSSRFGGPFGSYQTLNNSTQGATMYAPSIDPTVPASPRFSFGATKNGEPLKDVRHKPRTSFMTHSIRGGLAKPATLECNIGPGDYTPRTGDIGENGSTRPGFGSSPRFIKAGLMYISAAHASANVGQAGPGPKYAPANGATSYQVKSPRTSGLKWIP